MSSINLLPKSSDFDDEGKQGGKSRFAVLVSIIIVLIPIIFYAVLYFENINSSETITGLGSEIEEVDKEIIEKIEDNKLLIVENKAADANNLLAKHPYSTKVIDLINENLIADLYLTSLMIDFDKQELLTVNFDAVAKNSSTIASQVLVFKNMSDVSSVSANDIAPTEEGYMSFSAELEIKEQIIFYKELSDEEKLIENCKEAEEEIKSGDLIIKIKVENSCYLVEAVKAEKTDLCEEIETDYNKCSCIAIINFLSAKSEEEKEAIVGDLEASYYETSKRILAEPILKETISSSCVMEDEEIITWCNDNADENEKGNCYLLAAIDNERKSICSEIENSCYECSCNALMDFLSAKSDEEKREIIGDREKSSQLVVDDIFKNQEVISAVNNLCVHICQN